MSAAQPEATSILDQVTADERLPVADPLCGDAADPVEELQVRGFRIMRCRRCGLVWSDPHLADDALARLVYTDNYVADAWKKPRQRSLPSRFWRWARGLFVPVGHLEKRWSVVCRWLPLEEPLRVLEVGCWTGELLELAATRAPQWQAKGIDSSPFAIDHATRLGLDVEQTSLEAAGFADASFGGVIAWDVLEHTRDPLVFLRAARRVLQPGARCILHVPNYGGFRARWYGAKWRILEPAEHRWHFTHAALARLLEATEAEVLHLRSFWVSVGSHTLAVVRWR